MSGDHCERSARRTTALPLRTAILPEIRFPDHSSLFNTGIQLKNKLVAGGHVCQPRYGEMSSYQRRLCKMPFKGLNFQTSLVKLLLYLDGFLSAEGRNRIHPLKALSNSDFGVNLDWLRISIKEITGRNPPRYRHYEVSDLRELTPEEKAIMADLELNAVLSKEPIEGHGFMDVNKKDVHEALGVPVPPIEEERLVTAYEVNLTRKKLGYGPKKGAVIVSTERYNQLRLNVARSHYIRDHIIHEVINPLMTKRYYHNNILRQGKDPAVYSLMLRCRRYVFNLLTSDLVRGVLEFPIQQPTQRGLGEPLEDPLAVVLPPLQQLVLQCRKEFAVSPVT